VLADRVRYFKEDEKGVASMSRVFEEIAKEAAKENSIKMAELMLESKKLSYEEIAEFTQLTIEEIKELDGKRTA
jgi:hypothetical protein